MKLWATINPDCTCSLWSKKPVMGADGNFPDCWGSHVSGTVVCSMDAVDFYRIFKFRPDFDRPMRVSLTGMETGD